MILICINRKKGKTIRIERETAESGVDNNGG